MCVAEDVEKQEPAYVAGGIIKWYCSLAVPQNGSYGVPQSNAKFSALVLLTFGAR